MRWAIFVAERENILPTNLPPRGLSRVQSAAYVGVSVTFFEELVRDGRMPKPIRLNSRVLWEGGHRCPHKSSHEWQSGLAAARRGCKWLGRGRCGGGRLVALDSGGNLYFSDVHKGGVHCRRADAR
jgi:hypothetical protein